MSDLTIYRSVRDPDVILSAVQGEYEFRASCGSGDEVTVATRLLNAANGVGGSHTGYRIINGDPPGAPWARRHYWCLGGSAA